MAVSRVPEQKAILLNDSKDLREYLKFVRAGQFIWNAFEHRISRHEWLKLSDDFTESEFETSRTPSASPSSACPGSSRTATPCR